MSPWRENRLIIVSLGLAVPLAIIAAVGGFGYMLWKYPRYLGYALAFAAPVVIVGTGVAWLRQGQWRWPPW